MRPCCAGQVTMRGGAIEAGRSEGPGVAGMRRPERAHTPTTTPRLRRRRPPLSRAHCRWGPRFGWSSLTPRGFCPNVTTQGPSLGPAAREHEAPVALPSGRRSFAQPVPGARGPVARVGARGGRCSRPGAGLGAQRAVPARAGAGGTNLRDLRTCPGRGSLGPQERATPGTGNLGSWRPRAAPRPSRQVSCGG